MKRCKECGNTIHLPDHCLFGRKEEQGHKKNCKEAKKK